ncbi:MAG: amino acid permease-associated region [Bacteroidetes bacterium]|nr:amino acid permease-associated region [Bacteroidota bacterium]
MSIWRVKPVSAFEADMKKSDLKRVLTKWGLTSLGIGAIIGGGIFTLTGIAANEYAGPALALSFVIAGIGCLFASLCYAEFASVLPVEGSAYAYAYGTVGELFAWFIGWNLILEYMMGLCNDLATATEKCAKLGVEAPSFAFNLPAFLITWIVTMILVKGIKEAASTNNIIVVIKIAVVLFVIIAGAFYINTENWTPFIPAEIKSVAEDGKETVKYGFGGVLTAATIVFFAYIGFDAVSTQAGEAINPKKDVPFAIVASLVICTVLYILVSLVLTGMVRYDQLDKAAPVASAFSGIGINWAVFIITLAATAGLTSVMLVMMLGQTRIFLGMAKDGLLPPFFKNLHASFKTPHKSTILVGAIISIIASLTPIDKISEMCSMGTLLAFAMVCVAVMILRFKKPELERPYRTPAVYLVGTLGVAFNIFLMCFVRKETWIAFVIWGLVGIIVYFLYSQRNSNLQKEEQNKIS